jgi:hypothetical protein
MMTKRSVLGVLVLGLASMSVVGPVGASEIVDYDGKSYVGAGCLPASSTSAHARSTSIYVAQAAQGAVCPIIKDNWTTSTGLNYAYVRLNNPAGQTITCTVYAFDYSNSAITWTTKSTTLPGAQTMYFNPYPPSGGAEGAYSLYCSLPQTGMIYRYVVSERP